MTLHIQDTWVAIGKLSDIPRRGARCVVTPAGRIAVFRTQDDQVYATEDRCPHRGGPLSQGIVHDASVTCPLHSQVISLETGLVRGPDVGAVKTFDVRVDRDTKVIELSIANDLAIADGSATAGRNTLLAEAAE